MEHLGPKELADLTRRWEEWEAEISTPVRSQARARLHLVFLLIRYGGLRLQEVLELDVARAIDTATGMLRVGGQNSREIILPLISMRPIRRILALPGAEEPGFIHMDQGFVRKKFYEVARPLGLDGALVGPRALRYARGLELLEQHIPLNMVQKFLGQHRPAQMAAFLDFAGGQAQRLVRGKLAGKTGFSPLTLKNSLLGIIEYTQPGMRSALVRLRTFADIVLQSTCPLGEFLRLELRPGLVASAIIEASQIVLMPEWGDAWTRTSLANCLQGTITSLHRDLVENFVQIDCPDGTHLSLPLDSPSAERLGLAEGMAVSACFPARAVKICLD